MVIKGKLIEFKRTAKKYPNGHKSDEKLFITIAEVELTKDMQKELAEAYEEAGKKFTPDWVKDFKGYVNTSTKFEIPALLPDGSDTLSLEDYISDNGFAWMGAEVAVSLVVKEGAVYPSAIKFLSEGKAVNPFRAFEDMD